MFRENVLTDAAILDRIATTMVPVAVDRWKAEDPKTPEGRFLVPFLKRHPAPGSPSIHAPDGRVLGAFQGYGDMAGRMRRVLEDALKAFGPVPARRAEPRETHPHRGRGVPADGRVSLAAYLRPSRESLAHLHTKTPVVSSVTLTPGELRAFAPPQAVAGTKWSLATAAAKKFARLTSPLCAQHAPRPDWVTAVRIDAEVRSVENGRATLRYHGKLASEHRTRGQVVSAQEVTLVGEGVYELGTGVLRSVLLVGEGLLRWPEAPEKRVTFEALAEWSREAPLEPAGR